MLEELVGAVARYTEARPGGNPFLTEVDGLILLRADHEKRPDHLIFKPALCIVLQGAKWAVFGDKRLDYRAGQALVVSVEMPAFGRVCEASPDEPYLGIIIEFDLALMRDVLDQLGLDEINTPSKEDGSAARGVCVTDFNGPLADCALRMVRLLDTPRAIPVLRPAIMREICYWLLTGPHAREIIRMTAAKSHARGIVTAIHSLRDRFAEAVRIDDLASIARMSPSAFHRQFKQVTSMTPLQYQKQLRMLEARRLMIAEEVNVETAAFQVGYESPSQFSREYSRMFGVSPRRHVVALRDTAA